MQHYTYKRSRMTGFTIVELLIVIVVVAILAAVTIVAYNGIQKRAAEASAMSSLDQASRKIALAKVDNNTYGASAPTDVADIVSNANMPFHYYQLNGGTGFCADIYSLKYTDIQYYIDDTHQSPQKGLCPGTTVPGDVSDYTACFVTESVPGGVYITEYHGIAEGEYASYMTVPRDPNCPLDIAIPNSIGGNAVLKLGNAEDTSYGGFTQRGITSIQIPNTVTAIGSGAFAYNKLTSVTIPDSVVSVESLAFAYNNTLTSLTLGNSITTIGYAAFEGGNLTEVTIPPSVTSIGYNAFGSNNSITCHIPSGKSFPDAGCDDTIYY